MGSNYKAGFIILICGILGLFVAAIQQIAFDNEYILHIYFEAAELPGLQIITIILALLMGCVLAALSS